MAIFVFYKGVDNGHYRSFILAGAILLFVSGCPWQPVTFDPTWSDLYGMRMRYVIICLVVHVHGACRLHLHRMHMLVLAFDLALLLSLVHTSSLEDTCSEDEHSSCDKGAQTTKGMTRSMSLLAAGHAERITVDGSEGIFVSIKTTEKYHRTRLPPVVVTWLQTLQPEQVGVVYIISPHPP